MNRPDRATIDASIMIVHERMTEHDRASGRAKAQTVYVNAAGVDPAADAAVHIVEKAFRDSALATALASEREYQRFAKALAELEALKEDDQ